MPIKIDSTNGSITLTAEDGSGNAGLTIPRAGYLSADGNGANLTNVLTLSGGAMTGAITTNSTFDGVDIATRDAILTSTTTTANAALPKAGGALTGALTTNSTIDGVDIATRDAVLTSTTTTANGALAKTGGAMTGAITTNSTFDGVDIATRDGVLTSTTSTANAALPKAGGAMTGAITTNSTFDGVDIATRDGVLTSTTATAAAALPKAGGTMSGLVNMADQIVQRPLLQDYSEKTVAMGSATAVNLEDGNVFSKTISGTTTLTFTNPSAVGTSSFSLILTNAGSATLNFPTVKWPAATAPTLTASGIDVLVFVYHGSTWYGIASGIGMA